MYTVSLIYLERGLYLENKLLSLSSLKILIIIVDIFICLILYEYTCNFHAFGISNGLSAYCNGIV